MNLAYYLVHTPLQAKEKLKAKYEAKARQLPPIDSARLLVKNPDWAATASQSGSYMERFVQSHATYAAMMESLDQSVGQLIQALKDKGLYDNTLIIFTSDNGGLSTAEGSPTSNLPLRGGKGWLYEGGIRVPFIIKPPKNQGKGQKIDIPVAGIDLLPTILSYLETDFQPKNGPIDGRNLRPLMEGNEFEKTRPLFWHYPHYANQGGNPGAVIRQDNMKLIEDFETGALELYDLSTDIGEQHNLAGERPELRDQLYAELKAWQDAHAPLRMDVPNTKWTGKIVDGKEVVEVK